MRDIIRDHLQNDHSTKVVAVLGKVKKTRQFWVKRGLLLIKENRLNVLEVGDLRKKLIHDVAILYGLISRSGNKFMLY